MADGPTIRKGKSNQVVVIPWNFIHACQHRFGPIGFDLAASAENTKAPFFFSEEQDSLSKSWKNLADLCWLNPEFDPIEPWAEKCALSWRQHNQKILMLVPASVGSNWFSDHVWGTARAIALNGRITFVGSTTPYPKDLMICAYGWSPGFEVWRWNSKDLI